MEGALEHSQQCRVPHREKGTESVQSCVCVRIHVFMVVWMLTSKFLFTFLSSRGFLKFHS